MSFESFEKLILSELQDVKNEIRAVRQEDIPAIKIDIAGFQTKLTTLRDHQTWSTRFYTVIGGAIAVLITKMTGHP